MAKKPHDLVDLYLAPVALELDTALDSLGQMSGDELGREIALRINRDPDPAHRAEQLLDAVTHLVELHNWKVSWVDRGLELAHDEHRLVLGVPASVRAYLES